jgi:hypothetical protein
LANRVVQDTATIRLDAAARSELQSVTRVLSDLAIWAMTAIRDAVAGVTYDD